MLYLKRKFWHIWVNEVIAIGLNNNNKNIVTLNILFATVL